MFKTYFCLKPTNRQKIDIKHWPKGRQRQVKIYLFLSPKAQKWRILAEPIGQEDSITRIRFRGRRRKRKRDHHNFELLDRPSAAGVILLKAS